MHKFYIFDLDGTLCDSMQLWRGSLEANSGDMSKVLPYMHEKYESEIKLKRGVLEFIAEEQSRGIKTCIASATDKWISQPLLDRTGLMSGMEFYTDCTAIGMSKRHPEFYHKVAEMLGADIADCAVFEDAPYCAESAKKAGFFTVGIIDPVTSKDGDLAGWCNVIVNDVCEFTDREAVPT